MSPTLQSTRLRKTRLRTKCAYLLAITTFGQMQHGMALLQSKRRVGRLSPDEQVSIHAPARGATFQQFAATSVIGVSIHAFEREQEHHRRRDRTEVLRFNPRCVRRNHSFPEYSAPSLFVHASRAGRDDWLQCPGQCTFQLACLARGVSNGAAHWVCNREFQSTCPARGTTMSATALTAGCQFHALLISSRSTPRLEE